MKARLLGPWRNAQLSDSRLRTGGGALERSNKYSQIVFSVSDWLDSLIGPGGLLLVISHLFAVPSSVLRARLGKKVATIWM